MHTRNEQMLTEEKKKLFYTIRRIVELMQMQLIKHNSLQKKFDAVEMPSSKRSTIGSGKDERREDEFYHDINCNVETLLAKSRYLLLSGVGIMKIFILASRSIFTFFHQSDSDLCVAKDVSAQQLKLFD